MNRMYTELINVLRYYVKPFLPLFVLRRLNGGYSAADVEKWEQHGAPLPPPHFIKQEMIRKFQRKYGYTILVESGTFLGDMVAAQRSYFSNIVSIELDGYLFRKAARRFEHDAHIRIVQGDSGKVLPDILKDVMEPCLFWLDGHYSSGVTAKGEKECPVFEELDAILLPGKNLNHVILIDDARLFSGKGGYPTMDELTTFVKGINENYSVEIENDVICFYRK